MLGYSVIYTLDKADIVRPFKTYEDALSYAQKLFTFNRISCSIKPFKVTTAEERIKRMNDRPLKARPTYKVL